MNAAWMAAVAGSFLGGLVQGVAGFALGLVALSFFAFAFEPVPALIVVTGLAFAFTLIGAVALRRDVEFRALTRLVVGTAVGTPIGVWLLTALPGAVLRRGIGAVLIVAVLLQAGTARPRWVGHPTAALAAGVLSGVLGGAVHAAGPPVVLYAAGRGWSGRAAKANLQAFFAVNQGLVLVGYAASGLLTATILQGTLLLALPALIGFVVGWLLFNRIDERRFRHILFALLLGSGVVIFLRG